MEDAHFHSYWEEWKTKLANIASKGSAQLDFPSLEGPSEQPDGTIVYKPDGFLILHNVRYKSSSTRSPRLTIFINGSFRFSRAGHELSMVSAAANISIFSLTALEGEAVSVALYDALHFDFEKAEGQTPYHPMFHVQRGGNNTLTDDVVLGAIRKKRGRLAVLSMGESKVAGMHHLRIPVPQLDYFSVIVMVVADFFCNPKHERSKNMEVLFKDILSHLCDNRNIAKEGVASRTLFGRNKDRGWSSSADWYAESVA
ncbi:hypothetical protein [Luteibacter sp.]|uniref:hypothetical protein n=1 Tax=Luteibacter sp. TaxID=1886636 RepID=UPI0028069633|nr:hypothetical protein [Luteibacter sp.]MDQ8048086.1 hypothetical protein [Luteibacter sp.]